MSMAVLGLLVERADTVGGIGIRVVQRFPDAHWARSAVYGCVPSLIKQGHVRLVKEGGKRSLDRFGATSAGAAYFRAWMQKSAVVPLVSRDALQGKLAFSTREDLLPLIGAVREEVDACKQKYASAHKRSRQAADGEGSAGSASTWELRMLCVQLGDQAKLWGLELRRLQDLLEDLEGILGELPDLLPAREAREAAGG
jgi:hypothetical protein